MGRSVDKILNEGASKSEKQALQSASQSRKGEALIWDQNQEIVLHSSKINGDAEKPIFSAQLLPKGTIPPPGPNRGHHGATLVADHKLVFQSVPKSPATASRPNPSHNFVTASEKSKKLHLESMPKGPTPPSGPNPGGNAAIFTKKEAVAAAGRDESAFNSLPKEISTPTSRSNALHNTIPEMSTKLKFEVELLPKGPSPPSSPNPGGNMIPTSIAVEKHVAVNRLDHDNSVIESTSVSSKTSPRSNPTAPPEEVTVSMLPKGFKPPSSPNKKHSEPSDIKNSLGISKAHQAAQSAAANSLDDNVFVLNELPKSSAQSPDPIRHIHTTASEISVDDTHREISELSPVSRRNLLGCQQDIMPFYQDDKLAPATLFRPPAGSYT
ncbi:hypothetical protein O6H91_20G066600 [Diphasiastrum complanatum]|nr:hypothetical protein O6H91_20G066600 [Diphasiastrum complanatum]